MSNPRSSDTRRRDTTRGSWIAGALAALLAAAPAYALQSARRAMGATGSDADPRPAVGTIVVAHGAGPEWNAQVQEVARRAQTGGPVEVSFLMGPGAKAHQFQDAAKRLAEACVREIVVVPLLISSHSV